MKILCVTHYYPPHIGGIEMVAKNQASRLAALGHEVTVITSKVSSNKKDEFVDGVRVLRIPAINILEKFGVPFPIFSISILFQMRRSVSDTNVVHIHDVFYVSSFIAAIIAKLYRKPVVLMQHVAMVKHPNILVMFAQYLVYKTTGAVVLRISDNVITINDRVKDFLKKEGVPEYKLIELPNGVDISFFHPISKEGRTQLKNNLGLNPELKTILFVGRFVPKKGFQKLLSASDSSYQIVFCGGERPEGIVIDDSKLIFLGKKTPKEIAEIYQAADIFILPSEDEGFPLSVQEAMASGLPIITSNDYGYGRYGFDRSLLVLLDDTHSDSIKYILCALINDEDKLEKMGKYSLEYAKKNFSWDKIIYQLEQIYKHLTT